MNKKFLSAILFGALTVASTGSFVSCKDYDDDIKNLQTQIGQLASKSDLQTQVGALEASLTAAKTSAESAVKTAADAVAAAKDAAAKADAANTAAGAAQDAANAANGAATDAKDAAEKAAAAVKAAEEKLAAAEEKVANIEAELASVKTLKAELESYTEAEVAKLQEKINTEVAALSAKVEALVGLHYVDLMISAASRNEAAHVEYAKFTPNTTSANYKALVKAFPEIADLKGQNINQGGHISMLVSPAVAKLMPEYTYELIDENEEVVPVALSNPTTGITRASGSEYWTVDVAPTFKKDGSLNTFGGTRRNPAYYALRVSEGEDVLYKTQFDFAASSIDKTNAYVTVKAPSYDDNNVDYASEIELVNSPLVYLGQIGDKLFTIENGYKNYYVIKVEDWNASDFACEKYGISVEGSKLVIKNMPKNVASVSVKLSIVALGINGSTASSIEVGTNTYYSTVKLTINNSVESTVELEAKSFEIGKTDKNKEYLSLYYSVEDLGWATPSQIYAMRQSSVAVLDAEGDPYAPINCPEVASLYFAKADKSLITNTATNAKDIKYVVVQVKTKEFEAGDYKVVITTVDPVNTTAITFKAAGDLTAVNPETGIAVLEALMKDGVLQVVGASDGNYITYDIKEALKLNGNHLTDGSKIDADGNTIAVLVDNDATDFDNWVSVQTTAKTMIILTNSSQIKVHVNKKDVTMYNVNADEEKVTFSHINSTVRNMTLNYYIGNNDENILSFPIKVMVLSPLYSEDATKAVTVANQTIYFKEPLQAAAEAEKEGTAPASFEVSELISKAVYIAGEKKGQEYDVFNTWTPATPAGTEVYLEAYNYAPYTNATEEVGTANYQLLTNKKGQWTKFTKKQLEDNDLLTASALNKLPEGTVYLTMTSEDVLYLDSKNVMTVFPQALNKTIQQLQTAFTDINSIKADGDVYKWAQDENANDDQKKAAKPFVNLMSTMSFRTFDGKFEGETEEVINAIKALVSSISTTGKVVKNKNAAKPAENKGGKAVEIASVEVKFDDPETAGKFLIIPAEAALKNAYNTVSETESYPSVVISSKSSEVGTSEGAQLKAELAGKDSVDLTGTITIKDKWGKEMKVPFKVTAKIFN